MPPHDVNVIPTSQHEGFLQTGSKRKQADLNAGIGSDGSQMRQRITRACDQCNHLRTKCDGKHPCLHCTENRLPCDYARTHKKRGRVPKKEIDTNESPHDTVQSAALLPQHEPIQEQLPSHHVNSVSKSISGGQNLNCDDVVQQQNNGAMRGLTDLSTISANTAGQPRNMRNTDHRILQNPTHEYGMQGSQDHVSDMHLIQGFGFPLGDDYSVSFMGKAPFVETPEWLTLPATTYPGEWAQSAPSLPEGLTYPVLLPLLGSLEPIIPQRLACDLLEQYFTRSTSLHLQPKNPYIIGAMFRKQSILHPKNPRPCSPALLASMLWISAQHSDAVFLTSQPDARSRTCQQLLELTISMLKPLIHNQEPNITATSIPQSVTTQIDGGLAGLVSPVDSLTNSSASRRQLDNIATYIHLATVVSASERKAASLRWWNAAWSLAREIRLGRELPEEMPDEDTPNHTYIVPTSAERVSSNFSDAMHLNSVSSSMITKEHREERRRVWWLLYMTDRHLALCYNRPLSFLNQECETLLLPVDDEIWQSDRYATFVPTERRRGLDIQCTSHSVFGYFLPLMVILGEILDLNYARNRPKLGRRATPPRAWNENVEEIMQYLKEFEDSISAFENTGLGSLLAHHKNEMTPPSGAATKAQNYGDSQARLQTETVVAYSRHIMHVLHILLTGKWDPIALLDDNDLWISSQSFVTATGHAVSAAGELSRIIELDPDLSLIPYFFGIYLLQGSFLLLLFADKLQENISADVVKACETIVRAHEACVATLDTQYQRNFRKVMRSALQQLRGRTREDLVEQQNWRRGILQLYRWTADGTGLAL